MQPFSLDVKNEPRVCCKTFVVVPAREMGPKELLKSSSSSFGRADDYVMSWDSSRPPAYPSARGTRSSGEHRMVGYLRRHSDAQVSKAGG